MKRFLIKISGEALAGKSGELYANDFTDEVAKALCRAADLGNEIAVVFGAGNIWRGRQGGDMNRTDADRMGMLATVINSLYMKDAIRRAGKEAVVMTAIPMAPFAELYSAEAAKKALSDGKIVICGCGLGIPFLSTDTAAAVRAVEIGADAMLMAKNVDYIYDSDPRVNPNAVKFEEISDSDLLAKNLRAIDATAAALCRDTKMTIRIFGLKSAEDIYSAVVGDIAGTVVIPE